MSNLTCYTLEKTSTPLFDTIKNRATVLSTLFLLAIVLFSTQVLAASNLKLSHAAGGTGGTPFTDVAAPGGHIAAISIRSGLYIDSIKITYRYKTTASGKFHGGNGGELRTFRLSKGEFITELGGRSGKFVDAIYIKTNKGRKMRWGGNGGKPFKFYITKSTPITGIWGRSGKFVDAIGIIQKAFVKTSNVVSIPLTPANCAKLMNTAPTLSCPPPVNKQASTRKVLPDGTLQIQYPDGHFKKVFPNGNECTFSPNRGELPCSNLGNSFELQDKTPSESAQSITLDTPPENLTTELDGWAKRINSTAASTLHNILTEEQHKNYLESETGKHFYDLIEWRIKAINALTDDGS